MGEVFAVEREVKGASEVADAVCFRRFGDSKNIGFAQQSGERDGGG